MMGIVSKEREWDILWHCQQREGVGQILCCTICLRKGMRERRRGKREKWERKGMRMGTKSHGERLFEESGRRKENPTNYGRKSTKPRTSSEKKYQIIIIRLTDVCVY
jgi:hypothetical protein